MRLFLYLACLLPLTLHAQELLLAGRLLTPYDGGEDLNPPDVCDLLERGDTTWAVVKDGNIHPLSREMRQRSLDFFASLSTQEAWTLWLGSQGHISLPEGFDLVGVPTGRDVDCDGTAYPELELVSITSLYDRSEDNPVTNVSAWLSAQALPSPDPRAVAIAKAARSGKTQKISHIQVESISDIGGPIPDFAIMDEGMLPVVLDYSAAPSEEPTVETELARLAAKRKLDLKALDEAALDDLRSLAEERLFVHTRSVEGRWARTLHVFYHPLYRELVISPVFVVEKTLN